MRVLGVAWLCLLSLGLGSSQAAAAARNTAIVVRILVSPNPSPSPAAVTNGSLDASFRNLDDQRTGPPRGEIWLQLLPSASAIPDHLPTLVVRVARQVRIRAFAARDGTEPVRALQLATRFPDFIGTHDLVFLLPGRVSRQRGLYVQVIPQGDATMVPAFSITSLSQVLAGAAAHARMIAITFGALMVLALAAVLIWMMLFDKLLAMYAALFALQALYIAYFSGQAFDWPVLSNALPLGSYAWNVPIALSGAAGCLFVREMAELKRFSPRIYQGFGWLAAVFVALAFSNVADEVGFGSQVAALGNVIFLVTAAFTLVVAFLAWRRDNRAAGWFLVAWGLLSTLTIATAIRLLTAPDIQQSAGLLYYALPASMVAAAVLIALGVADKLRDQRIALTEAKHRAQVDPLTGVLNRRSFLERLDAACLRTKARGLPLALLFIDLDHFKAINDTRGHAAGDACLKAIIDPIRSELRQSDDIGRYGGEEFVVVLGGADAAAARVVAERIRRRVADTSVTGFGVPINLTCSIGIAASDLLSVWGEHLIERADEAVYVAKRSGRNQVQMAASASD